MRCLRIFFSLQYKLYSVISRNIVERMCAIAENITQQSVQCTPYTVCQCGGGAVKCKSFMLYAMRKLLFFALCYPIK